MNSAENNEDLNKITNFKHKKKSGTVGVNIWLGFCIIQVLGNE